MPARRSYARARYGGKKKKRRTGPIEEIVVLLLALFIIIALIFIVRRFFFDTTQKVSVPLENVAAFAIPAQTLNHLETLAAKYSMDFPQLVTVYSITNQFFPTKFTSQSISELEQNFIIHYDKIVNQYKAKDLAMYAQMFENLLNEMKYFPVMTGYEGEGDSGYVFADTYGATRDYGGDRTHLGTDILDRENIRGRIPVASITDGEIESVGWNELGGFQIGIRSRSNTYYYYAHLDHFAEGIVEGAKVSAGQLIGYMGDSGYSKKEGATGNFPVHLHVGISPDVEFTNKEFWINPYAFLRFIEDKVVDISGE